jgi:predicted site-specific integrase-resolvase
MPNQQTPLTPLLKAREVGLLLQVRPATVYSWAKTGFLPAIRLHNRLRFEKEKVLALMGKGELGS